MNGELQMLCSEDAAAFGSSVVRRLEYLLAELRAGEVAAARTWAELLLDDAEAYRREAADRNRFIQAQNRKSHLTIVNKEA